MHLANHFVQAVLLAVPALCYSQRASSTLQQLTTNINQTNDYINHLEGCGYKSTTQAISNGVALSNGSACPMADDAISGRLTTISNGLQSAINSYKSSRTSHEVSEGQTVSDFSDFATAFYALFNAMDLAECTYILTTNSKSFAIQFSNKGSAKNLKDGFNSLVAELSSDPVVGLQISGTNLKQQTHFGGTSLLATQVGGPKDTALAGCKLITAIVQSEGGGSS